jgi:hypothetical protein
LSCSARSSCHSDGVPTAGPRCEARVLGTEVRVKPDQNSSRSLLAPNSDRPRVWDDVRLQKLWLAAQRREWRSLAVLGASKAMQTLETAELLAQLAWRYRGEPSIVCDLRDLSLRLVEYQVREIRSQVEAGARVLVALRSIFENPTASSIAREVDAVLCVLLGQTEMREADQTLAEIGRERVLGSIILREQNPLGTPSKGG